MDGPGGSSGCRRSRRPYGERSLRPCHSAAVHKGGKFTRAFVRKSAPSYPLMLSGPWWNQVNSNASGEDDRWNFGGADVRPGQKVSQRTKFDGQKRAHPWKRRHPKQRRHSSAPQVMGSPWVNDPYPHQRSQKWTHRCLDLSRA